MKPFFSVILPTYNRSNYLARSITSVLNQSFRDFELIIIDDGSSDNTKDIINKIEDLRIIYKYQHNQGQAKARNIGIKLSKSEWVCFIDSDDLWMPNKLNEIYSSISKKNDFIHHKMSLRVENNENNNIHISQFKFRSFFLTKNTGSNIKKPITKNLLINGNKISTSSVVVRKEILEKINLFNEQIPVVEDYDLWIRVSQITNNFLFISKVLGIYRVHKLGLMRKIDNITNLEMNVEKRYLNILNQKEKILNNSRHCYSLARNCFHQKKYDESLKFLKKSLAGGNFSIKLKSLMTFFIIQIRKK